MKHFIFTFVQRKEKKDALEMIEFQPGTAEHSSKASSTEHQEFPAWTWFIDNPRPIDTSTERETEL